MNENLMRALVDVIVFFEFCSNEDVADEIAGEQIGLICHELNKLNDNQREDFRSFCKGYSEQFENNKVAAYVADLPKYFFDS